MEKSQKNYTYKAYIRQITLSTELLRWNIESCIDLSLSCALIMPQNSLLSQLSLPMIIPHQPILPAIQQKCTAQHCGINNHQPLHVSIIACRRTLHPFWTRHAKSKTSCDLKPNGPKLGLRRNEERNSLHSPIHSVVCLTTGPQPLPKLVLHRV